MTEPAEPARDRAAEREARAAAQQARAEATLRAIFAGGDLAEETTRLSNEFTDDLTGRLGRRLRRRRPPEPGPPAD